MFQNDDPNSDKPMTERIPSVLISNYLEKGYTLYTHNFYTSTSLGSYFLKHKTYLCGTIQHNRPLSFIALTKATLC